MEGPDWETEQQREIPFTETCRDDATSGPEGTKCASTVQQSGDDEEENRCTYRVPSTSLSAVAWNAGDGQPVTEPWVNKTPSQTSVSIVVTEDASGSRSLGRKNGTVTNTPTQSMEETLAETFKLVRRFYAKTIHKDNGCREWTGAFSDSLYGTFSVLGKTRLVHRFAYKLHKGDIPNGMLVCHKCDNPKCCNPDHLFLGNASANMKDASDKGRLSNIFVEGGGKKTSTLDKEKVLQIRMLAVKGVKVRDIGNIYGVKASVIRDVINKRTWKNV